MAEEVSIRDYVAMTPEVRVTICSMHIEYIIRPIVEALKVVYGTRVRTNITRSVSDGNTYYKVDFIIVANDRVFQERRSIFDHITLLYSMAENMKNFRTIMERIDVPNDIVWRNTEAYLSYNATILEFCKFFTTKYSSDQTAETTEDMNLPIVQDLINNLENIRDVMYDESDEDEEEDE